MEGIEEIKVVELKGMICAICGTPFTGKTVPGYDLLTQTLCERCGNRLDTPLFTSKVGDVEIAHYRSPASIIRELKGIGPEVIVPRIPSSLLDADPALLPNQEVSREGLAWTPAFSDSMGKPGGVVFVGNSGTGKTYTAALLSLRLAQAGHVVIWKDTAMLAAEIDEARGRGWEAQLLRSMVKCEILVLDDFCNFGGSQNGRSRVCGIIKLRAESRRKTIVTTQHARGSMMRILGPKEGDAIANRFKNLFVVIPFDKAND